MSTGYGTLVVTVYIAAGMPALFPCEGGIPSFLKLLFDQHFPLLICRYILNSSAGELIASKYEVLCNVVLLLHYSIIVLIVYSSEVHQSEVTKHYHSKVFNSLFWPL